VGSEQDLLSALARFEASARRSRPYWLLGIAAIVAGFAILSWQLHQQKLAALRSAEEQRVRADQQTQRADHLQATLSEAATALGAGDRGRLERALQTAQRQTQQIGAAATQQGLPAQVAQLPLEQLEVRVWTCAGSPDENRTLAAQFHDMEPPASARRWRESDVSLALNARPNFRLSRNEIRYNPEEAAAADQLQRMIRQSLRVDAAKVLTFYPSPRSVSVFFCQGAEPPPLDPSEASAEAN